MNFGVSAVSALAGQLGKRWRWGKRTPPVRTDSDVVSALRRTDNWQEAPPCRAVRWRAGCRGELRKEAGRVRLVRFPSVEMFPGDGPRAVYTVDDEKDGGARAGRAASGCD